MVMDANDFISHTTHFDEFVILSGDADFTPLLHRLRAHNRRSVIFANDFTAAAYKSICDSEIKEATLMSVLLEPSLARAAPLPAPQPAPQPAPLARPAPELPSLDRLRAEIVAAIVVAVKGAGGPVPLEALAERTTRALGHDRTVGTSWAGNGSFLELLRRHLPAEIGITAQPPYLAYDTARVLAAPAQQPMPLIEQRPHERIEERVPERKMAPAARAQTAAPVAQHAQAPQHQPSHQHAPAAAPVHQAPPQAQPAPAQRPAARAPVAPPAAPPQRSQSEMAAAIQASIARIHEACQAPPLSPPDYRALFEIIAQEISDNSLQGAQTMANIQARTQQLGLAVTRDDIRFIMEVVSEADPWFEQGVSAVLFAGRFRNFVVARCRGQGLQLSGDELDLIDAWFAGTGQQVSPQAIRPPAQGQASGQHQYVQEAQETAAGQVQEGSDDGDQFPKILRTRLRG
ncbi:unnamed protein product [Phaeothamnion confervicola]